MKKRNTILKKATRIPIWAALLFTIQAGAQAISIDRGVRAEGLWCFPLVTDSLTYLYLPDKGVLGMDDNKRPQFSFIRYVNDAEATPSLDDQSITKAGGGGIIHFLVTYDTDESKVRRAEAKLREIFSNGSIKLRGPILFKEGRYALVSSILNPDNGKEEKKLLAIGAAPVLQGSRIALSFEMDPVRSTLLLNSLQMSTPDVSIVFDMTFSGLMDAYNAKLIVDWTEVNKSQKIATGGSYYYFSADLELVFEELRRTSAIRLETAGEDANMQRIVDAAYTRIIDMMFQKVEPEPVKRQEQSELDKLLGGIMGKDSGSTTSSNKVVPFSAHSEYRRKNIKTSGFSTLYFNSRSSVERHHYITFNISDFYKKYGKSESYFMTRSLSDPDFLVRQIAVGLDGALLPEFDKMINNITVTLRKTHQDGNTTLKEVSILKSTFDKDQTLYLAYGSVHDTDRLAWLNYDYNAQFSFTGGRSWQTGWITQNSGMINLFTPYERRMIKLEADPELLISKNVRATSVIVEYEFLDGKKSIETTVKPTDDISKKQFEITLPTGQFTYKYTIRWQMKDGSTRSVNGETDMGIIFIDTVPDK